MGIPSNLSDAPGNRLRPPVARRARPAPWTAYSTTWDPHPKQPFLWLESESETAGYPRLPLAAEYRSTQLLGTLVPSNLVVTRAYGDFVYDLGPLPCGYRPPT